MSLGPVKIEASSVRRSASDVDDVFSVMLNFRELFEEISALCAPTDQITV